MSNGIKVVSFDPALRNLGVARVMVDPETFKIEPIDLKLVQTSNEAGKTVRKSSDDYRRAQELAEAMREYENWADIVMAEVPSGSQSARACLGAGVCIGLLASLRKPLVQLSPGEVKKATVGRTTSTKDEIIFWAYGLYPSLNWLTHGSSKRPGKLTDACEHCADALAIAHAGVKTSEFRAAAAMHLAMQKHTESTRS